MVKNIIFFIIVQFFLISCDQKYSGTNMVVTVGSKIVLSTSSTTIGIDIGEKDRELLTLTSTLGGFEDQTGEIVDRVEVETDRGKYEVIFYCDGDVGFSEINIIWEDETASKVEIECIE